MTYTLINGDQRKLKKINSNSIDFIYTSPPYNVGTTYGSNKDSLSYTAYLKLLSSVYKEASRVLHKDGLLIVEAADTIYFNGTYVALAGLIQNFCVANNLNLIARHINFANIKAGKIELPEDRQWDKNYTTKNSGHSNCHQILVFANNTKSKWANGEIIYYPYKKHPWHPCPTPKELTNFILMKYFKKNDRVLDPFMGTGAVGKEALQRGAKSFIGIEIDKSIYEKTKKDFDITFNNH